MKFTSYIRSFGFTRNEIKVILLLSVTFLFGLAIRYYNAASVPAKTTGREFDYSIPDSIFEARSRPDTQISSPGSLTKISSGGVSDSSGTFININIATADELVQLPGIGPTYAARIVTYRKENGPFASVDDLENVKGIGKKRMDRLRPFVRVK